MNQAIEDFIKGKRIAVVGVSRNGNKFGNIAYKELKERGYQVFPVNPAAQAINGEPCYPDLEPLKNKVDGVLVTVPAERGIQVLEQAAQIGVRNVWVQQQAESAELLARGEELGLNLVSGKCILMYAQPVRSFHAWHRAFVKLFGRL